MFPSSSGPPSSQPSSHPSRHCCGGAYGNNTSTEPGFVWDQYYHPIFLANLRARGFFVLHDVLNASVVASMHAQLDRQEAEYARVDRSKASRFLHPLAIEWQPNRPKLIIWPDPNTPNVSKALPIFEPKALDKSGFAAALHQMSEAMEGSFAAALNELFFVAHELLRGRSSKTAYDRAVDYRKLVSTGFSSVVSGSAYPGSQFQNPHWDVKQQYGAQLMTINVNTVDVPDRSWAPFEIWPATHLVNFHTDVAPFSRAGPRREAFPAGGEFTNRVCWTCHPEVSSLASIWPSTVITGLRRGAIIVRNPATWHRGTPNEATGPRHMLAFGFQKQSGRI